MIEFGRVRRGVVWHLLDEAAGDTWCRAGDPIIEWTRDQPPLGARPCPRCRDRVRELAQAMDAAVMAGREAWEARGDERDQRPVEDVDLVGALADRQLRPRDEGPDPQADEEPEDGAA